MKIILLFICSLCMHQLVGQNTRDSVTEQKLKVSPGIGISWRSDAMNLFRLGDRVRKLPFSGYPYSDGGFGSGFGLNTSITLQYHNFGLEYAPSFLYDAVYDEIYKRFPFYERKVTVDHHFGLFWQAKNKMRYGIAYMIFYDNLKLKYNWDGEIRTQNMEFSAWALSIAVPIKDILTIEGKVMYAYYYPDNPYIEAMLYGLRAFYTFDLERIFKKE